MCKRIQCSSFEIFWKFIVIFVGWSDQRFINISYYTINWQLHYLPGLYTFVGLLFTIRHLRSACCTFTHLARILKWKEQVTYTYIRLCMGIGTSWWSLWCFLNATYSMLTRNRSWSWSAIHKSQYTHTHSRIHFGQLKIDHGPRKYTYISVKHPHRAQTIYPKQRKRNSANNILFQLV